jgi:hypothetical protein
MSNQDDTFTFDQLSSASKEFRDKIKFHTNANLIETIAGVDKSLQAQIAHHANTVRILVHEDALRVMQLYLTRKQQEGTHDEQALYANMTAHQFIQRLVEKRPLSFLTSKDTTLTRDGRYESDGTFLYRRRTDIDKKDMLPLEEYLTYEEMAFAALVGVSSPTFFINAGDRNNCARLDPPGTFEPFGIMIGLVGARFEVPTEMEARFILSGGVIDEPEWKWFYGDNAISEGRFIKIKDQLFDTINYRRRMRLTFETLLLEAEARAVEYKKKAYVHVVGYGLGVWQVCDVQTDLFVEEFFATLAETAIPHVEEIDFSWFNKASPRLKSRKSVITKDGEVVRIRFSNRSHAEKLQDPNLLLVSSYAWDGNSYPGNEFWLGSLRGSGDPAAVCCSTIGELQNPIINPFTSRIKVLKHD